MDRDSLRQQVEELVKKTEDLLNQYRNLLVQICAATPRTVPEGVPEPLIGTVEQQKEAERINNELNSVDPDYLIRTLLMVPFDPKDHLDKPLSVSQEKRLQWREHEKTIDILMLALAKGWLKPLKK